MELESREPLAQHAPIARHLPAELVTKIINFVACNPIYGLPKQYLPDDSIAISHVCKFWRNAALGSSSKMLWTHAPLRHSASCVRAFMERSHPLPVFFAIEVGDASVPTSLTALTAAVTYMDRVEEIAFRALYRLSDVYSPPESQLRRNYYEALSSNPAPSLKRLTWAYTPWEHGPDGPLEMPSNLFAERVSNNLRHVKIVNMGIDSYSAVLRAPLTSLELGNCFGWNSVDDLLDTLSCMPGLERFVFDSSVHPVVNEEWTLSERYTQRSINLPCLRTLCFTTGDMSVALSAIILFYLRIPISARLHLVADFDENTHQEDLTRLRGSLAMHYRDDQLPGGQRFTFSAISIGLRGGNAEGIILHAWHNDAPCLSLSLATVRPCSPLDSALMMGIVHCVMGLPVTSHTTRFNVAHSNWFAMGRAMDWSPLRNYLPDLRTICISRTALHGLAPVLLAPPTPHLDIIFPNLSCLSFESLTFDKENIESTVFFLVALTRIAQHRAAHGRPLKSIEFLLCSGAGKLAKQLSAVLPDVKVTHSRSVQDETSMRWQRCRWDWGGSDIDTVE